MVTRKKIVFEETVGEFVMTLSIPEDMRLDLARQVVGNIAVTLDNLIKKATEIQQEQAQKEESQKEESQKNDVAQETIENITQA